MKFSLKKMFVLIVLLLSLGGSNELCAFKITHEIAVYLATVACPKTDLDGYTTNHDRRVAISQALEGQELSDVQWDDVLEGDAERAEMKGHLNSLEAFVVERIDAKKINAASVNSGLGKGAILVGIGFLVAYLAQNRDRVAELARLADEDPKKFAEFVWGEAKGLIGLSKDVVMAVLDLGIADLKPSTYTSFKENPVGNSIKLLFSTVALVGGGYAALKGGKEVKRRHDDGKSWSQAIGLTVNLLVR